MAKLESHLQMKYLETYFYVYYSEDGISSELHLALNLRRHPKVLLVIEILFPVRK